MRTSYDRQTAWVSFSRILSVFGVTRPIQSALLLMMIGLIGLPAVCWSANLKYGLDIKVNVSEKKITGVARLTVDSDEQIDLFIRNLDAIQINGNPADTAGRPDIRLVLKGGKETVISYEARFPDSKTNHIDEENVFLTEAWYPRPNVLTEYRFSVTLPRDFIANSEHETVTVREQGQTKTFMFHFNHPLDALHLAASTRYVLKRDRFNDITIEAYFFKEDAALADSYISFTKKYLSMYESMLTPFPYKRFAIVENIFPSGNSMPTYTLLGRQVVHLPFIVRTSLGHEILHEWFGNSVYVDFSHGNWSEGLTSYLSDHQYAELEGRDIAYRKQIMVDYHAYVNAKNAVALSDFHTRGSKAQSAVGYGKAAMLFHGLRKRFGDEAFFKALKEFIRQNSFRKSSWHDIQRAFESVTGEKLYAEFGHWLTRTGISQITVKDSELRMEQGQLKLNFTLMQKGEPYPLRLPVAIYTDGGKSEHWVEMKGSRQTVGLKLDDPPTRVVVDESYDLMRRLNPEEIPPVLAAVMGRGKLTAVVSDDLRSTYQPLIDALGGDGVTYTDPALLTSILVNGSSLLIPGYDLVMVSMLFGNQAIPEEGVRIKVYKHPYFPEERIVLLHARNQAEARAAARKLAHYGKYTELAFNNGKNSLKTIAESDNGVSVFTRPATPALKPAKVSTLDDIVPGLADNRIIYVGEQHDKFAHHLNQLRIIKKLHDAGYELAVGMEAFQIPYQQTVDDYLAGRIDERTFLEKSEYFSNWRYDYNLYKPIIDYLKQQGIPMIALNIAGGITRKVSREGMHNLTDEEKQLLPSAMDFSNEHYRRDLNQVFTQHASQQKLKEFNYFMQAQTIWDEVMAESAQKFLAGHPERRFIVLAGNGHVRRKYGIPERLYRRNREPFVVVVQDEKLEPGLADYVLLTTELKGLETPKLGVGVEEKDQGLAITRVVDHSRAGKAGLQKGDIITRFMGQPIKSLADLKLALFYAKIGEKVTIQVERNHKTMDKEIEPF